MKKTFLQNGRRYYALLILFIALITNSATGQLTQFTASTSAQPINICGPAATFTVLMNPGTTASTTNKLTITLPVGLSYVAGSAGIDNGANISSIGGTATAPVFNVPTLPASSATTLSFNVVANCSYGGGSSFAASITTANIGSSSTNSSNINANAAVFIINAITNQNFNGALLTSYSRAITITNTGGGYVDTLLFKDTVGNARTATSLTGPAGSVITLVSKVAINSGNDTAYVWKITNLTGVGDGDSHFENSESFTVTQNLTIVKCTNTSDRMSTELNCTGNNACNQGKATGGVTIPTVSQPNISITVDNYSSSPYYPCVDGSTPVTQSFVIKNTAGPAYNVHIVIGTADASGVGFAESFGTTWIDPSTLQIKTNTGSFQTVASDSTRTITGAALSSMCAFGKTRLVRITVPVLNANDSVRVKFNVYACLFNFTSCVSTVNLAKAPVITQIGYSASCASAEAKSAITQLLAIQSESTTVIKASGLSSIFPNENYTLVYTNSTSSFTATQFPTATTVFSYEVKLPAFLSLSRLTSNVDLVPKTGSISHPVTITQLAATSSDTTWEITFRSTPISATNLSGTLLYLKNLVSTSCIANTGVTYAPVNIKFKIRGAETSCYPYEYLSCLNDTLAFSCPANCVRGGLSGERFNFTRTNYGLADSNNDGIPDGTLDMSKVRTDLLIKGDTAAATISANVVAGANDFIYGYFEPNTSSFSFADNSLQIIDAGLSIYRGGSLLGTCNNLPLTKTQKNQWRMDFSISKISTCIAGYSKFEDGDSLVAQMRYYNDYGILTSPLATVSANIMGDFYLSNIANPVAAADKYACDTSYASLQILPVYYTEVVNAATGNGCDTIVVSSNHYFSVGPCCSNYNNLQFWFEYRPVAAFDRIVIGIPSNLKWAGKATITALTNQPGIFPLDISGYATVYADSVVFNIRQLYADNGGPLRINDEGFVGTVQTKFLPLCATGQTTTKLSYQTYFKGISSTAYNSAAVIVPIQPIITVNAPAINIATSPQTITVTGNTAVWDLQISNTSSLAAANFTWLAQNIGGTTFIQKLEKLSGVNGTVIALVTPANGIYQLGDFDKATNTYYRLTVGYANCIKDTINLKYGYSCFGYPSSLSASLCSFSALPLYIVSQQAQLQFQVQVQPTGPQTLCTDTVYRVKLTNVQPGTVYGPTIQSNLPASGFIIEPGTSQVEYPRNTFTNIADPVLVNGSYKWDIAASIPSLAATGMVGNDSLKLTFKGQAKDCSFTSGDYLTFQGSGVTGCGTSISTLKTSSNPFILVGDPLTSVNNFKLRKTVDNSNILACAGQSFTYTYVAVNNGPNVSDVSREAVEIEVPSWLTISNFTPSSNGGTAPDNGSMRQQNTGSITIYSWTMPANVAVGDSVKFSVLFTVNNTVPTTIGCTPENVELRDMVVNSFSTPATCVPGGLCQSATIKGSDTISLSIQKYQAKAASLQISAGNTATLTITNTGAIAIPAGTLQYSLYADMNSNGVYDAADNVLLAGPLVVDMALSPAAVDSFAKVINLTPIPVDASGKSVLLVVKQGSCNCESWRPSQINSVPLPVELLSFTVTNINCENTINWTTIKEQNIVSYSVERSVNGRNYESVAVLQPAGSYELQHSYNFSDNHITNDAVYYYRLRTNDADGKYSIGTTVSVNVKSCNDGTNIVTIFPNPLRSGAQMLSVEMNSLHTGSYQLRLYDMYGRVVNQHLLSVSTSTGILKNLINVKDLSAGVYIVQLIKTDNTFSYQKKVIIQ
ncbi:T9SS type A sorting domain-containing protein [Pinibacter aurantiacus]|uniref:T9SS type A sorting domain-containing protein n=1 Tax=Pinibacter aurantiacus TaxID=2851599 RepID=A0A9E2W3X6_9BACT|nr:T9SS type A sorting domain-containing protein [Pinibacter aurantiacus]MBV4359040.1 T9SS type A sorting domain-containing protein [Pinibacter aurantiacus]